MKIFKITLGDNLHFVAAKNEKEANEKAIEIDATYAYLPINIEEFTLEGYKITLKAV